MSYNVIRFLDVILTWLWNKIFNGVQVNGLEPVKKLAEDHEIVYVPCHRSHLDYLLLSYTLYYQGLNVPHIAAGENLNMPVVGALLRRGGAFFIRRKFGGDKLYTAVFNEYMHSVFSGLSGRVFCGRRPLTHRPDAFSGDGNTGHDRTQPFAGSQQAHRFHSDIHRL